MKHAAMIVTTAMALLFFLPSTFSQETLATKPIQNMAEEKVFGWELMSVEERREFQNKFRSLKTTEERQRFRQQHHEKMRLRAQEQGVDLQDRPNDRSSGQRRGPKGQQPRHNPPAFSEFDSDNSGFISADEFSAGHANRIATRAKQGYAMRNAGNAPKFSEVDANSDGRGSSKEFAEHQSQRRANKPSN